MDSITFHIKNHFLIHPSSMKPQNKNYKMKTTNIFIRYKQCKVSVEFTKYDSIAHFVIIYPLKFYIATYPSFFASLYFHL